MLAEAAALLRAGRLVAFPTETVYGLGANALDEAAVRRIYEAKGRPAFNPIIVHVASADTARALAAEWTAAADALARAFWPGPLTLVVRRAPAIPDIVTAGGDTVGVRVPAHPVALALLREAAIPVAAPSANLSMQVSPTSARHVQRALGGGDRVDLLIDGGETRVGIESTVVDTTGGVPRVLRPGMISREAVAGVAGGASGPDAAESETATLRSPGLLEKHYAPRARARLFPASDRRTAAGEVAAGVAQGRRVGTMVFRPLEVPGAHEHIMPAAADHYARVLYATLHALDDLGCDVIWIEEPPPGADWAGILDRLRRAAWG